MSAVVSPWISFLRQYGPVPQGENAFDELLERAQKRWRIVPIKVELEHFPALLDNFRSAAPRSIILTGTAGDGKTYYCREVWRELNNGGADWNPDAKVQQLDLGMFRLVVIKDLSEISGEEKREWLRALADALAGVDQERVFLVAANDGQLLDGWSLLKGLSHASDVKWEIEDLLVSGQRRSNKFNFDLYNLSRTTAEKMFPRVLEAVLNHPGWQSCEGCDYRDGNAERKPCPIQENKRRLSDKLTQQRLGDLFELAELNGWHLPIRQLLLLTANALLGHVEAKEGLLTCKETPKALEKSSIAGASLYRNIFGENLTPRRRDSKKVFQVLRTFGIGSETSNFIDNILIFGEADPALRELYQQLMLADPEYGADRVWQDSQQAYLEGAETRESEDFLDQLAGQRQRLFFVVPPELAAQLRLWELTTFHFAEEYLNKAQRTLGRGERVAADITARLVRGLNRIFTGMLAKDDSKLILATSGSLSLARISRVYEDTIPVQPTIGQSIRLERDQELNLPVLMVSLSRELKARLPLNLRRYEYLSRIAEGALPGSFSRECYEDLLSFKTTLLRRLAVRRRQDEVEETPDRVALRLISRLNSEGYISSPDEIEVKLP